MPTRTPQWTAACRALALALFLPATGHAEIPLGATGPDFTKTALGGGEISLSQYPGKVIVLFLLGYS